VYQDIEHIFVDGGSTDGTLDRIRALDGNVKLLTDVGGGISRAMNVGVEAASGEVIAHLHSDDLYVHEQVITTVANAFERHPDVFWLYGKCKHIVNGEMLDNSFVTKRFTRGRLLRANLVPHPATFIRRLAFLRYGGFDASYKYTMDYDLWLRLAKVGAPLQLDEYLAAFRFHDGSLSTSKVWACHNECLKVRLRHTGPNPIAWAEHLARHVVRAGRMVMKSRHGPAGA